MASTPPDPYAVATKFRCEDSVLTEEGAYAVADSSGMIISKSFAFKSILSRLRESEGNSIWDVFPVLKKEEQIANSLHFCEYPEAEYQTKTGTTVSFSIKYRKHFYDEEADLLNQIDEVLDMEDFTYMRSQDLQNSIRNMQDLERCLLNRRSALFVQIDEERKWGGGNLTQLEEKFDEMQRSLVQIDSINEQIRKLASKPGYHWYTIQLDGPNIPTYSRYAPIHDLRQLFYEGLNTKIGETRHLLFSSFDKYLEHLPFRQSGSGEWQKLCLYPYYARDDDMNIMARRLEEGNQEKNRPSLRYLVAPSAAGKTASVAAAFALSAKSKSDKRFSHYLYIAFSNNKEYNFKCRGTVSDDRVRAERQGAEFMYKCVERLLTGIRGEKSFEISPEPPQIEDSKNNLRKLFERIDGRILFHLDEHKQMKDDPNFRRGALTMMAEADKRFVVVATYVEPPLEVPNLASSSVCRCPIAVPLLDVEKVMEEVQELKFRRPNKLNADNRRLWASLLFRLGCFLKENLNSLHLFSKPRFQRFLADFENAWTNANPTDSDSIESTLKQCIELCRFDEEYVYRPRNCDAVDLLLGIEESDLDGMTERVGAGLIAYADSLGKTKFTASASAMSCKGVLNRSNQQEVCRQGFNLFQQSYATGIDILQGTPLERAFLWTFAVRLAAGAELLCGRFDFKMNQCKNIQSGRLFDGVNVESFSLGKARMLDKNTIYVNESDEGGFTHPFGDIFFRSEAAELVLIDITGSAKEAECKKKTRRLSQWVVHAGNEQATDLRAKLPNFLKEEERKRMTSPN